MAVGALAQRAVDRSVRRRPVPGRLVEVDGRRLHLRVVGPDHGPTVLAQTGLGGTSTDWDRVMSHLDPGIRLVAIDRPGLGRSEEGPPPTVATAVAQVEAVTAALGVPTPVVLLGWSLGGLLDLGVALVRPDLVSGLVLVEPSHPEEARRFGDAALRPVGRLGLRATAVVWGLGGALLAGVPSRVAYVRSSTRDGRKPGGDLPTFATGPAGRALIGGARTRSPLPVTRSAPCDRRPPCPPRSRWCSSAADRPDERERQAWTEMHQDLAGWIPGTSLERVDQSGHDVPSDRPDAVADAVDRVVRAVAVASGTSSVTGPSAAAIPQRSGGTPGLHRRSVPWEPRARGVGLGRARGAMGVRPRPGHHEPAHGDRRRPGGGPGPSRSARHRVGLHLRGALLRRDRWWEGWLARGWRNSAKKPVANRDLWEPLVEIFRTRDDLRLEWVKGHSGDEMNDLVDRLAVKASHDGQGISGTSPPSEDQLGPPDAAGPVPAGSGGPPGSTAAHARDGRVPEGWPLVVVGVRSERLVDSDRGRELRDQLARILAAQHELHPDLVVLSGLRPGAGEVGALAAVDAGVPLTVVLPYPDPTAGWSADTRFPRSSASLPRPGRS